MQCFHGVDCLPVPALPKDNLTSSFLWTVGRYAAILYGTGNAGVIAHRVYVQLSSNFYYCVRSWREGSCQRGEQQAESDLTEFRGHGLPVTGQRELGGSQLPRFIFLWWDARLIGLQTSRKFPCSSQITILERGRLGTLTCCSVFLTLTQWLSSLLLHKAGRSENKTLHCVYQLAF